MTKRSKRIKTSMVVLMAVVGLVGCATQTHTTSTPYMPSPVTENGMTLNWGSDVKAQALKMIQGSTHLCYLDMYELSDPDILQALTNAHQRGVDVRVIVDATESHSKAVGFPKLKAGGVPVVQLRIHSGISHLKMLITDGDNGGVLIGGMNYGENSWNNNDASVFIRHPNPSFAALFRWDWSRAHGAAAAAPGYQMPLIDDRRTEDHIVQAIQSAENSIYLEAFNLSDNRVMNALKAATKRDVLVEVLLDPGQYQNRKSANELRDVGATVRFYSPYSNEWMHAKILDVDKGKTFIIGSANFSHQAYTFNHEADIELNHMNSFHKALEDDLSVQIARGTDYPAKKKTAKKSW